MEYEKTPKRDRLKYTGEIQHRTNRRGKRFWIIIYSSNCNNDEGYIHLPDDWQDADRTYTAQDIYWADKYDCKPMRLMAA